MLALGNGEDMYLEAEH